MTRERAAELWPIIKAYGERREIQACYSKVGRTWSPLGPDHDWDTTYDYQVKPEPKMRPMTRGEVLYMVTTTPGMVVRFGTNYDPMPASAVDLVLLVENYEYAIIDASGEPIDGWHKFEKEVSE